VIVLHVALLATRYGTIELVDPAALACPAQT
jgi:hypothetical protein